jgi:hypothetical protein
MFIEMQLVLIWMRSIMRLRTMREWAIRVCRLELARLFLLPLFLADTE